MPPALDRRQFLQAASASALVSLIPTKSHAIVGPDLVRGPIRVAVLNEPSFPAMDTPKPDVALLGAALDGLEVSYLTVADLGEHLSPDRHDVFVMPYGSAFPKEAWPALQRYLRGAGNWVNVGGVPCAVPVERAPGAGSDRWRAPDVHPIAGAA